MQNKLEYPVLQTGMKSFPAEGRHEALNKNLKSQMPRLVGGVIHSCFSFLLMDFSSQ